MIKILRLLLSGLALLVVASCGQDSSVDTASGGPDIGSALVPLPIEERRVAIVHSVTSRDQFYDPFDYDQLFASMQGQATQAGFPFDLLAEENLIDAGSLLQYDAILIPSMQYVQRDNRAAIVNALLQAQAAGVGLLTSGALMSADENGQYFTDSSSLREVVGLEVSRYLDGVSADVIVSSVDHPITDTYALDEVLTSYEQIWFGNFVPASGEQSTVFLQFDVNGDTYPGAQVVERAGRVLHYANEQIMADNQVIWKALQWLVYGDVAPVTLQMSRDDSIFIARNDMDQAMTAAELPLTEIPLLEMITDWKRDYNFVGSYYIDIGNNPLIGQYTDWSVSAPLYQQYIALGNEIGTHSWSHPHYTSTLTDEELEYEFNQSKQEISTQLGVPVIGGAVPGNPESLNVVENLNQWFTYFSGRAGKVGSGYPRAIGFLEPQHDMMYFSLNMSEDFRLIDIENRTPAQATAIWANEIDALSQHAQQPIFHWLWHDYGPTTGTTVIGTYSEEMFEDTIAYASSQGTEFTTLANLQSRIRTMKDAIYSVGSGVGIDVSIAAGDVSQFALKVAEGNRIESVSGWYAYDDDQVFLAEGGGNFQISVGDVPALVSRITKLPMRARLLSVSGDGNELNFSFSGKGDVNVTLSPGMTANSLVSGASSFTENGNQLVLSFATEAVHTVSINAASPINRVPVAEALELEAITAEPLAVLLLGADEDNDALSFSVLAQPANGTLSGTPPNLVYTSNVGFSGVDTFSYVASDGILDSAPVNAAVAVTLPRPANSSPVANRLVLATVVNQPVSFVLTGSDNENQALAFSLLAEPVNGAVSGTAPNLVYTPGTDFSGIDQIEFTVSDGSTTSEPASVVFNVEPQFAAGGGTVSNERNAVVVDGVFDEWAGATAFAVDPDDVTGTNNVIDWHEAWMGHDDSNFYIAYRLFDTVNLSWGHSVFMDTDTDDTTGFHGFAGEYSIGVDYAVEGDSLFRYTGLTQNAWSWSYVGSISSAVAGNQVELQLSRALIGNPNNVRLFFVGDSAAVNGTSIDFHPDDVTNSQAVLKQRRFSYSVDPNLNLENVAPVANAQEVNLVNNAELPVALTGSDLNSSDSLSYRVSVAPMHGVLTGVAPNLVYQADVGYVGTDEFFFIVNDGVLDSNAARVAFNVVAPSVANSTPVANAQSLSTPRDVPLVIELSGSDADGGALTYTLVTPPQQGLLSGTPPDLIYTADSAGTITTDSFTFKVNDRMDDSQVATVAIAISDQVSNTPPVANGQNLVVPFDTALGITLSGTDADNQNLTFAIQTQPLAGSLEGVAPDLTYVPFDGVSGADFFTFVVSDGVEDSQPASINIEVQPAPPVNLAPIANGLTLSTPFAMATAVTLTATDPEAAPLNYQVVTPPGSGTLTGTAPELIYTPNESFSGLDSFRFVASDGMLDSTEATVTINVGEAAGGAVSNSVTSITVDGVLTDWTGVTSFGLDPDDVTGPNNPLDWREVWVAHSATDLFIAYRNDQAFQLSWGHGIYIDTDGDPTTGFKGFAGELPVGADILIEVDDVYEYTGNGNNWSWGWKGSGVTAVNGDTAELGVPRALLGNPTDLQFYLRASNVPFGGTQLDHYPDAAVTVTAAPEDRRLSYTTVP